MTQRRSVLDIPIFHKLYDLYKHLHSYQAKIPKAQRYTLWQRCEHVSLLLLEQLVSTSHLQGEDRVQVLHAMSGNVDLLKILLRLAEETGAINKPQYLEVQCILQEVGKMLGGWLKSVAH